MNMRKAILVDDDHWALADIRASLSLEKHSFNDVSEFTSAEKAYQAILNERPDLIVTDICMADLNGIDLVRRCREKMIDAYIIIISGYDRFEFAQQALNVGANYYLLKPLKDADVKQALTALETFLFNRGASEAADTAGDGRFTSILYYISSHYRENLNLALLSKRFYMDKSYLSRLFRKNLNMTFTELRQRLQIGYAIEQMKQGKTAEEASSLSGFNDLRHFYRVFRNVTGTTPNAYRQTRFPSVDLPLPELFLSGSSRDSHNEVQPHKQKDS